MSSPALLTVAGTIPANLRELIAQGKRPRADFLELAAELGADVIDHAAARSDAGRFGRLIGRFAGDDVLLAMACFRRRKDYRVIFTDSERIGFPFAALSRFGRPRARHVMVGHRLSPPKKLLVHRLLGLRRRIDHVFVYSSSQRDVVTGALGYGAAEVTLTPFMVDTAFWRADDIEPGVRPRPMICAVGQELRDYPTLIEAVRGVDVDVVLAAGSPWSRRDDSSSGVELPDNVTVTQLDQFTLRQLYADAALVVVPVQETDFQAGITTILEAMSMGLAVVCSRTEGQTDTIVDGETGLYVPPGDAVALRDVIRRLLDDPAERTRLGAAAREWVGANADITVYARRLAAVAVTSRDSVSRRV